MRKIALERLAVAIADRTDAAGKGNSAELVHPRHEIGMLELVEPDHDLPAELLGFGRHRDAVDAVSHIDRVGRLAHFAVADDVDSGRDLLRDDLRDRGSGARLESGLI